MHIFLATELTAGPQNLMDDERIKTQWFAPSDVGTMIRQADIQDGKTIIGYYAWRDQNRQVPT